MRKIRVKSLILVVLVLIPLISMAVAVDAFSSGRALTRLEGRPAGVGRPPKKVKGPTVSIAYPANGSTLELGTYAVDVKATGEGLTVTVSIDGGEEIDITGTKSGDYYVLYPWIVDVVGTYSVTVEATDLNGNKATATITVEFVETAGTATHEIVVEIDYMEGHEPTTEALNYIIWYYSSREISVAFYVDDTVPYDQSVSDSEFWAIEAKYNDGSDKAQDGVDADGDGSDYEYMLKEKWVLYGTEVEGEPSVIGYTYVQIEGKDLVAGNYIFIADEAADEWSIENGLDPIGAETCVLMHELGHSIGIAKLRVRGPFVSEIYDEDPFSVMSYLSAENAELYWAWHYSNEYWETRNMDYYVA